MTCTLSNRRLTAHGRLHLAVQTPDGAVGQRQTSASAHTQTEPRARQNLPRFCDAIGQKKVRQPPQTSAPHYGETRWLSLAHFV